MDKSSGFVNEQQCALQDNWNEIVMYRKLCHGVVTHDKPMEGNARDDKQTMNATFERKSDFDFEKNLVEGTTPEL